MSDRSASTTEHLTDMDASEEAFHEPDQITHWYPEDPLYRRSGSAHPQPGDIAWCGHVKADPARSRAECLRLLQCAQCMRIRKMHGARER
jgi:hypothetical protein